LEDLVDQLSEERLHALDLARDPIDVAEAVLQWTVLERADSRVGVDGHAARTSVGWPGGGSGSPSPAAKYTIGSRVIISMHDHGVRLRRSRARARRGGDRSGRRAAESRLPRALPGPGAQPLGRASLAAPGRRCRVVRHAAADDPGSAAGAVGVRDGR